MIGALTTNAQNIVSNRNTIAPVRAIPKIYLETHQTNQSYEKFDSGRKSKPNDPRFSANGFNPYFAAHILSEAGFGGEENNLIVGNKAYAKKKPIVQNTIAIA